MMRKINAILFLLFFCSLFQTTSLFGQSNRSWSLKLYSQFFLNDQQQSLNENNMYPFGRFSPAVSLHLTRERPIWIDFQLRRFAFQRSEVASFRKTDSDIGFNIDITWEQARAGKVSLGAGAGIGFFYSKKDEEGISQDQTIFNQRITQRRGVDLNLLLRGIYQINERWNIDCKLALLGLAPTLERKSTQFPTITSPIHTVDNTTFDVYFIPQINLGVAYKIR